MKRRSYAILIILILLFSFVPSAIAETYYFPKISFNNEWKTEIIIYYEEDKNADMKIISYDEFGNFLELLPEEKIIELKRKNGFLCIKTNDLFPGTKSLKIESNKKLNGFIAMYSANNILLEIIPVLSETSKILNFPTIPSRIENKALWRRLIIFNPSSYIANIQLFALNENGALIDSFYLNPMLPNSSLDINLNDIFFEFIINDISTIKIVSDNLITGLQLFGFQNGEDIAALPVFISGNIEIYFPIVRRVENTELLTTVSLLNYGDTDALITTETLDIQKNKRFKIDSILRRGLNLLKRNDIDSVIYNKIDHVKVTSSIKSVAGFAIYTTPLEGITCLPYIDKEKNLDKMKIHRFREGRMLVAIPEILSDLMGWAVYTMDFKGINSLPLKFLRNNILDIANSLKFKNYFKVERNGKELEPIYKLEKQDKLLDYSNKNFYDYYLGLKNDWGNIVGQCKQFAKIIVCEAGGTRGDILQNKFYDDHQGKKPEEIETGDIVIGKVYKNGTLIEDVRHTAIALGSLETDDKGNRKIYVLDSNWKNDCRVSKHYIYLHSIKSLPRSPSDLKAKPISYNQINLSWKDNSNNETGFLVERSEINEQGPFTEIIRLFADKEKYEDKGLQSGKTYFYRVKAYVKPYIYSEPSNIAYAKTLSDPTVNPTLSVSPKSGKQGTIFNYSGSYYTPNGTVEWHVRKPDGTEYPPSDLTGKVDANGNFSHSYTSHCDNQVGTYIIWAIDKSSGERSNDVIEEITSNTDCSNHTVTTPNTPSGASSGEVNKSYTYSTGGSSCSKGHSVEYRFDWGDDTYSSWSSSTSASHSWSAAGTYTVKAQARCSASHDIVSGWSSGKIVTIGAVESPVIWRSPSSMSFAATEGGSNPSSQTLQVKNTGGGTLSYSISDDAGWLSVSPTSGSSTGGTNNHTVSVNISGISAGTYNATITITASGVSNSPQTVSVTLAVNPASHTITTPETPSGASSGEVNKSYTYSTGGSSCSKGHSVEYRFDWGDDTYSSWSSSTSASHSWSAAGTYTVKAQARCSASHDIVSGWSSGKIVTINHPPEAKFSMSSQGKTAYENQTLTLTVSSGGTVTVNFSAARSYDSDGSIVSYEWKISGAKVNTSRDFNFDLGEGTHQIYLTVEDDKAAEDSIGGIVDITITEDWAEIVVLDPPPGSTVKYGTWIYATIKYKNTHDNARIGAFISPCPPGCEGQVSPTDISIGSGVADMKFTISKGCQVDQFVSERIMIHIFQWKPEAKDLYKKFEYHTYYWIK